MKVFLVKGFTSDSNETFLVGGVYSKLDAAKDFIEQLVEECNEYIDDEFIDCNPIIKTEEKPFANSVIMRKTISVTMSNMDNRSIDIFKYNMIGSLQIDEESYKNLKISASSITFNLLDLTIMLMDVDD